MAGNTVSEVGDTDARLTIRPVVRAVRQPGRRECGITCLSMVLESHGQGTALDELRAECPAGEDGVSLRSLAVAARRRGFRARALAVTTPDAWQRLPLPAIALFYDMHFVVIEYRDADAVQVVDPIVGRYLMRPAAWDGDFSGVVLTLEPETPGTNQGT